MAVTRMSDVRPALRRLRHQVETPARGGTDHVLAAVAYELSANLGHGSLEHRTWLREALLAYFQNRPIPDVDRP